MAKNKDLTRRENSAVSAALDDPLNSFGEAANQIPSKVPVARIEYLATDQTKQDHPEWQRGKFSINIGEQLDHLEACILGIKYSRMLWPPFDPDDKNPEPLCKSDNGLWPTGGLESPKTSTTHKFDAENHPVCVAFMADGQPSRNATGKFIPVCPYAMFGQNREAPTCKEVFTIALFEHQLNIPVLFTVKSTGIKHLSDMRMALINFEREFKGKREHPITLYAKLIIKSIPVKNWFEPHFEIAGKFGKTELEMNLEAYNEIQPNLQKYSTDDISFDGPEDA
ncbi:MAG: hypothetical protein U5R06_02410 [candidate division KSB1 bacterium]|nr:hypothetical protein [candidate division KSB1 bacterium]